MQTIFVRHGELNGEDPNILHGANDPVSLSEKGRNTMTALSLVLGKMDVGVIVSSPEIRTKESAEIIARKLSIPTQYIDELQGRKWGDFSGKSWSEVSKILSDKTLEERYEFTPPNGESWKQFESRMLATVRTVSQDFIKNNVCIVSHGSSIRVLLPKIFGIPVAESLKLYPGYGSISEVEYDGQNYINPLFNQIVV